jgi:hypothetical protein
MRYVLLIVSTWIFLTLLLLPVRVMGQTPATTGATTQEITTNEVKGEVTRIDGNMLTVRTSDNQVQQFTIPEGVRVTRNTLDSELNQIEPGDNVNLVLGSTGEILDISAVSAEVEDAGQIGLPVLIGLAVLALLGAYLWKKSQKGKIKTEVATSGR